MFAAGNLVDPLVTASWERFKYGGRPAAQQRAFFVSLQELTNNKFGTASDIYWDDRYLNAQVGASARGTYTCGSPTVVVHPQLRPGELSAERRGVRLHRSAQRRGRSALQRGGRQPVNGAVGLHQRSGAGNRIVGIQQDAVGFARCLGDAVEANHQWRSERGLEIVSTAIVAIEYDAPSRELLKAVQRADALSGVRATANLQAATAAASRPPAPTPAPTVSSASAWPPAPSVPRPRPTSDRRPAEDHFATLAGFKRMLDAGLITQDDYNAAKAKALGL